MPKWRDYWEGKLTLLRHVAMVAKSLDDNKKWLRTVSNLLSLIQFQFLCQILAKFSGVESVRTVSKLRRRKENFCVMFAKSIKQARQIRSFMCLLCINGYEITKKCVTHAKLLFCTANLSLFCHSHCCCRRCLSCLLSRSRHFATMVMWHHTSPLQ